MPRPTSPFNPPSSSYLPMYPVRGESDFSIPLFCGYIIRVRKDVLFLCCLLLFPLFFLLFVGKTKEGKRPTGLLRSKERSKQKETRGMTIYLLPPPFKNVL